MQAPVPCAGCTRLGPMCSEAHRHRVRPGSGQHCRARQGTPLPRMALGQRAPCWAQSCFLRRLILARTRASDSSLLLSLAVVLWLTPCVRAWAGSCARGVCAVPVRSAVRLEAVRSPGHGACRVQVCTLLTKWLGTLLCFVLKLLYIECYFFSVSIYLMPGGAEAGASIRSPLGWYEPSAVPPGASISRNQEMEPRTGSQAPTVQWGTWAS